MGFLDFINRMIQGKPVFEAKQESTQSGAITQSQEDPKTGIRKGDEQSYPVVKVPRITNHEDDNHIRVYCHILNTWPEEIMLDKIRIFGTKRELDGFLRGGEEREFLVYDGPRLQKEIREAQIDYKTQKEADYFQATFDVTFNYHESNKAYTVSEMHPRGPIRDIYE